MLAKLLDSLIEIVNSLKLIFLLENVVSPTFKVTSASTKRLGILSKNMRKMIGPRTEVWGTPLSTSLN